MLREERNWKVSHPLDAQRIGQAMVGTLGEAGTALPDQCRATIIKIIQDWMWRVRSLKNAMEIISRWRDMAGGGFYRERGPDRTWLDDHMYASEQMLMEGGAGVSMMPRPADLSTAWAVKDRKGIMFDEAGRAHVYRDEAVARKVWGATDKADDVECVMTYTFHPGPGGTTMSLDTREGQKVKFLGRGGYDGELRSAFKIMTIGDEYTVESMDVGDHSSSVYLKEFPDKSFNTVMFGNVEEK